MGVTKLLSVALVGDVNGPTGDTVDDCHWKVIPVLVYVCARLRVACAPAHTVEGPTIKLNGGVPKQVVHDTTFTAAGVVVKLCPPLLQVTTAR